LTAREQEALTRQALLDGRKKKPSHREGAGTTAEGEGGTSTAPLGEEDDADFLTEAFRQRCREESEHLYGRAKEDEKAHLNTLEEVIFFDPRTELA
ncbi:unnamed protein product, partial [Amoebophrya sp. A25]